MTNNDKADADKISDPTFHTKLQDIHCSAVQHLDLNSRKSVIVRGHQNENTNNVTLTDLFKLLNSSTIKITFATQDMTNNYLQAGIYAFAFSIQPCNLSRDKYVEARYCHRCIRCI